jgi:hypothetical protein
VILLETLVAISVISTTVLAGLSALSTASVASSHVTEETNGAVIAISQIELIRTLPYVATGGSYALVATPPGIQVANTTAAYTGGNASIQNVTITVTVNGVVAQEQTIVKIDR